MKVFLLGFCYAFFFYGLLNYLQMRVRICCEKAFEKKREKYKQYCSAHPEKPSEIKKKDSDPLKVVFLHPDLGIGGAERLVIDAAMGLIKHQKHCCCEVRMVTTHHDAKRAFPETTSEDLTVISFGDWMPRSLLGKGIACCTTIRMLYAAFQILRYFPDTDVLFVDQVPAAVAVLRKMAPHIPCFFYCHFPDQFCDGRRNDKGEYLKPLPGPLKAYRDFFDNVERKSMNAASAVYCNSQYSRETTLRVFPSLNLPKTNVIYPPVPNPLSAGEWKAGLQSPNLPAFILQRRPSSGSSPAAPAQSTNGEKTDEEIMEETFIPPKNPLFVSINRYERKKNIELAILAFCIVKQRWRTSDATRSSPSPKLVVGGGYDIRLAENKEYEKELRDLVASKMKSSCENIHEEGEKSTEDATISEQDIQTHAKDEEANDGDSHAAHLTEGEEQTAVLEEGDVIFLHNVSAAEKAILFHQMTALLYTPLHEHFGIVPLEAMQVGKPVVAVRQCGPIESVGEADKDKTAGGLLVMPDNVEAFADAMFSLAIDAPLRLQLGEAGRKRVAEMFSLCSFSDRLAKILLDLYLSCLNEESETRNDKKTE